MSGAIYPHVLAMVYDTPWAVTPKTMEVIVDILQGRVAGLRLSPEDIEARLTEAAASNGPRAGAKSGPKNIAVLPIYGVVSPRAGLLANSSGGSSVEGIRRQFRAAMADDAIDGVLFDIDSPGGAVHGIPELASEISAARGGAKPVVALANHVAYSAAYWLGSAAEELYVAPSGGVGSIGVIAVHEDRSGALERAGVKPTYITSSKYKAEGNPAQPLDKEAKAEFQREVDGYHRMFIDAVAAGRGEDAKVVESDYGQGRTVRAQDALERGMVDGIHTMDSALQRAGDLAANRAPVVQPANTAEAAPVLEPFAVRLERVLAEAEAVALHAQERALMRSEQGRKSLSADTISRLEVLGGVLESLVAAEPVQVPSYKSKVQYLDLMINSLKETVQ